MGVWPYCATQQCECKLMLFVVKLFMLVEMFFFIVVMKENTRVCATKRTKKATLDYFSLYLLVQADSLMSELSLLEIHFWNCYPFWSIPDEAFPQHIDQVCITSCILEMIDPSVKGKKEQRIWSMLISLRNQKMAAQATQVPLWEGSNFEWIHLEVNVCMDICMYHASWQDIANEDWLFSFLFWHETKLSVRKKLQDKATLSFGGWKWTNP